MLFIDRPSLPMALGEWQKGRANAEDPQPVRGLPAWRKW